MRGTPELELDYLRRDGIIPAYAGNTIVFSFLQSRTRDHPRVCGEHWHRRCGRCRSRGSSPRMRGTPDFVIVKATQGGIIPAYAGNTNNMPPYLSVYVDHPRVCGEHEKALARRRPAAGIIPAYAGNTASLYRSDIRERDHPRVCGEHALLARLRLALLGSSPRMRGTLALDCESRFCGGIIPAYAGNTALPWA